MSRIIVSEGTDTTKRTLVALEELSPALPKKGSRILIKPNLLEPRSSDSGAITRPEVIEAVIQFLDDNKYKIGVRGLAIVFDGRQQKRHRKHTLAILEWSGL